jgi:arylsulfatase A-like enzyme
MATADDMVSRTFYARKFYHFVLVPLGFEDLPGRSRAASVVPSVLAWMKCDRNHPSFTFVNFFDLHEPYLPPRPWRTRFSKLANPGGKIYSLMGRYEPKPEDLQGEIDAYDGAISYLDEQIGNLLGALEREGLARDTVIVATSDHGEMLGEHGLYHHRNALYRPLIRVPLILAWPDKLPRNMRIARPVSNAALAATFLDLLGEREQSVFPIRSLVPLWASAEAAAEWPLPLSELAKGYFEPIPNYPARYGSMKSLVAPDWHFICHERDGAAVFDWKSDPDEVHDLALSPEGQRITAEAVRIMNEDLGHPAFPNCAPGAQTRPKTSAGKP